MANQWANQAIAGQELRLDPCHLPQTVAFVGQKTGKAMICSLSERGVSMKTGEDLNTPSLSHLIPPHYFKGIAARAVETSSGFKAVSLELLHSDCEVCIPLLVSRDLNDVLLDWRLWADTYDLPMLLVNDDGSISPVRERAPLHHFFGIKDNKKVQQKFLLRYRSGSLGVRLVVSNQVMLG